MANSKKDEPKHDPKKDELVEKVSQERPPGKFDVEIEDFEAGQSTKPGPEVHTEAPKANSDNEFGVDLSHLTPSARERTLAEMREGARRVGNVPKGEPEHKSEK